MAKASAPDTTSSDYEAMRPYWHKIDTILGGAEAMRNAVAGRGWRTSISVTTGDDGWRRASVSARAGENPYMPKFPEEADVDYRYRVGNAPFTNIFADILSHLAAKPFAEEVQLVEGAGSQIEALAEDIDGRGNNLHQFAGETFYKGAAYAIDWIFVEYSKARPRSDGAPLTQAEEQAQGLRPYWVHIPATDMLAVYSEKVRGQEVFTHARWREFVKRRDGFGETIVERVRVLDRAPILDDQGRVVDFGPPTFTLWERSQAKGRRARASSQWEEVESGTITIGEIALVPFITGRREGGSWRFVPVLRDAADAQIEHFQAEGALKSIKELTAFPMLAGNGVEPEMLDGAPRPVPIGPRAVLYARPQKDTTASPKWEFIEPTAESLKFLQSEIDRIAKDLRELGRQPLTAQTGNLTVVTTAFAAQKGNSAVQAWALNLKDALEQALVLTAKWLKVAEAPEVRVFSDFALELGDDEGPTTLLEMRKAGDLSQRTLWSEAQRRNILSADFDAEAEEEALLKEAPDEDERDDLDDAGTPDDDEAAAA